MLFGALMMVSWGYAAGVLFVLGTRVEVPNEFFANFFFLMMIPVALGTLPFAWFGRWKISGYSSFKSALLNI
jgi:hypothetical protein